MQLPETQNAHHVHAFKKGYRLALEGKTLNNMPSAFRYDRTLREYYEQGWSQANEEMEAGYQDSLNPPWRNRVAWFVVMVIGSLATAVGLINGVKQEQAEQQSLILGIQSQQPSEIVAEKPTFKLTAQTEPEQEMNERSTLAQVNPSPKTEPQTQFSESESRNETLALIEPIELATTSVEESQKTIDLDKPNVTSSTNESTAETALDELSILTKAQRQDLVLNKQEIAQPQLKTITPQKVIASNILIEEAQFSAAIDNREPSGSLGTKIPKQVRKIYFFNQLKGAENKTIYHRWVYKNQEMALIPLTINSNLYRTWSSKRMTSAWQGLWTVEVLDQDKNVIYRQTFQYGNG